jgi:hypothetical protein
MIYFTCSSCGKECEALPTHPGQKFCSEISCQRARKNQWQRSKRLSDPDYLENQHSAQQAWAGRNQSYWSDYRASHPTYAEANRTAQRKRAGLRAAQNEDASSVFATGIYEVFGPLGMRDRPPARFRVRLSILR